MLSTIYGTQGLLTRALGTWASLHPGHPGIESDMGHDAAHLAIVCAVLGPVVLMGVAWLRERARVRSEMA
jgi:hypothetical protein